MKYYSEHSTEYIENTINSDMKNLYFFFEKYLPNNSKRILDLGFGSGRDSLYFAKKYDVCSLDPTKEFCEHGKEIGLMDVRCQKAEDMNFENEFDGIWACASLLHVPSNELNDVFKRCYKALNKSGIMYCSFKYGDFKGIRNERYFADFDESSFRKLIIGTDFKILEIKITEDVRPNRSDKWLNVVLKRSN